MRGEGTANLVKRSRKREESLSSSLGPACSQDIPSPRGPDRCVRRFPSRRMPERKARKGMLAATVQQSTA